MGKKSFLMYTSWMPMLQNLPDQTLVDLMRAIAAYHTDEEYEIKDPAAFGIFQMIKTKFDEDRETYEETCRKRKEAGSNGGKKKADNADNEASKSKQKLANASKSYQKLAKASKSKQKLPDTDTEYDTDTDTEYDTDSDSEKDTANAVIKTYCPASPDDVTEIIGYLNSVCGTNYQTSTPKTRNLIKARMKEHFTVDDFKDVIDKKAEEWRGTEQEKYLRPETLFGTKFESYLNQPRARSGPRSATDICLAIARGEVTINDDW